MTARAFFAGLVCCLVAGCGDEGPACPVDDVRLSGSGTLCLSAWELSRRATAGLAPTQDEVDAAMQLVVASGAPLYKTLARLPRAAWWFGRLEELSGSVTHVAAVDAWQRGSLTTGVQPLDAALSTIGATSVRFDPVAHNFTVFTRRPVATKNVQRALAEVPGIEIQFEDWSVNAAAQDIADEGIDPADGGHRMRFQIGWFDCPVGCAYLHFWRTKLFPDGHVILVEEWGDPIPPDVLAQWAVPVP